MFYISVQAWNTISAHSLLLGSGKPFPENKQQCPRRICITATRTWRDITYPQDIYCISCFGGRNLPDFNSTKTSVNKRLIMSPAMQFSTLKTVYCRQLSTHDICPKSTTDTIPWRGHSERQTNGSNLLIYLQLRPQK